MKCHIRNKPNKPTFRKLKYIYLYIYSVFVMHFYQILEEVLNIFNLVKVKYMF